MVKGKEMTRFQTKQIHLSTDSRKPKCRVDEAKDWFITIFRTACGKECLREKIRMRTNEVTCKSCIATERYKYQLAEDNKKR